MKKYSVLVGTAVLLIGGLLYLVLRRGVLTDPTAIKLPQNNAPGMSEDSSTEGVTIIAENLDTPWAVALLPDGGMLVTERPGRVRLVDGNGNLKPEPIAQLPNVREVGEGGLMGIALHPDFSVNGNVYLYYTYSGSENNTLNRVVRMTYQNQQLSGEQIIVDDIPSAPNHNGGRIKFGPDGYLYITTGDAQNPSQAQDRNSLAGKILRVTDQGQPVPGNPFGNLVYSYGHRNPQGITWDGNGQLWETEHGPSGSQAGNDEVNLIRSGGNYGWPDIQGNQTRSGMETPKLSSGETQVWAPSGAVLLGTRLFFVGLRGQSLYEVVIQGDRIIELKEHFKGQYGRLREVVLDPDRMLYVTTSNRDGRGAPGFGDDKIIRVNPNLL